MTYLQRSSELQQRRRRNLVFVGIFALIVLLGIIFRDFSARVVHGIAYPLNKVTDFIVTPIKNVGYYFYSKPKLVAHNTELENEKKFLQIELLTAQTLVQENKELRALLDMRDREVKEAVAEIVLTPPFSPYDTFVVRGNPDEISVGQSVFVRNIFIGRVAELHNQNAIIKLSSTPEHKTPVKINDEIIAEAEGQGGLSFKINIPKDAEVSVGDPIYSMEHNNSIIGFVSAIDVVDTSSFKTVLFQYPFNFSEITFVQIRNSVVE
jgi:cell shape-determining protein MreC